MADEMEVIMDYGEPFWEDDVYFYMASQPPASPRRANNDSHEGRNIWAEMEQNERMANIVSAIDGIGLREFDVENNDDGDVEMQMVIEQSLMENLDIVAEFAAQPTLPPYQPSEDLPTSHRPFDTQAPVTNLPLAIRTMPLNTIPEQVDTSQRSFDTQAPVTNFPLAIRTMPLNTIPEQVENPTAVATTDRDMPPTYSSDSESEWEAVSQGATRASDEDEFVIVPSSPPPAYSEDSDPDSDSDGYGELV